MSNLEIGGFRQPSYYEFMRPHNPLDDARLLEILLYHDPISSFHRPEKNPKSYFSSPCARHARYRIFKPDAARWAPNLNHRPPLREASSSFPVRFGRSIPNRTCCTPIRYINTGTAPRYISSPSLP